MFYLQKRNTINKEKKPLSTEFKQPQRKTKKRNQTNYKKKENETLHKEYNLQHVISWATPMLCAMGDGSKEVRKRKRNRKRNEQQQQSQRQDQSVTRKAVRARTEQHRCIEAKELKCISYGEPDPARC